MKGQPFFFDSNNFDDDSNALNQEEDVPPPLEHTAEELEQAKAQGFEEGKKAGFNESQSGLSKQILLLAQQIDRTGKQLLLAEDERSKLHETEVVNLSLCILNKLFPVACKKLALEDIKEVLKQTLKSQKKRKDITIEIHPDALEEIQNYLTQTEEGSTPKFKLEANPERDIGECRVLWADGGILYDTKNMAEKITSILDEALAAQGINRHDNAENHEEIDSAPLVKDIESLRETNQDDNQNNTPPSEDNQDKKTGDTQ